MEQTNNEWVTGEFVERKNGKDIVHQLYKIPSCQECDSKSGIKPSVHSYRGPYFCIQCCNYLDIYGRVFGGA
jgi:hypothetical protein